MSGAVILGRKVKQNMAGKSRAIDVLSLVKAWHLVAVDTLFTCCNRSRRTNPRSGSHLSAGCAGFHRNSSEDANDSLDDSVFDSSPERLALAFPEKVHLVKLILRNQATTGLISAFVTVRT